jgi:HEAT repeats/Scaffold protein Nfu/NifU N terminal
VPDGPELAALFDGPVVPEATPSPRTIRFATPPLGEGPSRAFDATNCADDPRVAAIFTACDEVTNVLVGPNFVAVTILHADRWAQVLARMLATVTDAFVAATPPADPEADAPTVLSLGVSGGRANTPPRQLDRAWIELSTVSARDGEGLDRIVAASRDEEPARRQVAAVLLADAEPSAAARHWDRLLADPSRSVRRAVVDTMGDAGRAELRPLFERALGDTDAWIRWRALHAIAQIGAAPSRPAAELLTKDPDFRVRLEATRVLAGADEHGTSHA